MTQSQSRTPMSSTANPADAALQSALRTLDTEASGVTALAAALQGGLGAAFTRAIDLMLNAKGRVIITGLGKSGHIGRKIAATFASTGTPAFFVHAAEASHGDLGMITAEDIVLAISWSGEQPEMKNLITYAKRFRISVIAMTAESGSTLAQAADIALTLPKAREACPHNLAPTTSSVLQLALGDALAIALLEGRGFTSVDFSVLHPGGKLGAMLKYVRDLMHSGAAIPLKPLGTKMSDRHMRPDLMTARVDEVMTTNPKTIAANLLAGEALEILNTSKITALIVTDGRKPVGIVHLHDLLRAGVA
ncbi:MAG: KpsF/GutQ family sugar-phosphate isomerase [Rhizobiales bacterium]|nr:KpsF/GutQ family sugar-phosphate isomerase [Hyphomicrobiales bacterium]